MLDGDVFFGPGCPIERLRQRLGVRDPERVLGSEPDDALARTRWREAQREVEVALPTEWHEDPMALDPYSAPRVD